MVETAEVVIVGAGFAGAATAYHLAERGVRDVILLEAEERPGLHASGKNAALTFQIIENLDEARLAVEGTGVYAAPPPELASRPLLERSGSLLVAEGEAGRAQIETTQSAAAALGLGVTILSCDEAIRRVPALRDTRFASALENPSDGVVDIRALLAGYLDRARRGGTRVASGERVEAIETAGGRVGAVTTSRRTIQTRCVVNAAGFFAGVIGELAGVGARTIAPRRRHIFQARAAPLVERSGPFVWHAELDVYFRPEGDGILTSACDATPHPPLPPAVDPAAEEDLRRKLLVAFPALAPVAVESSRACLRTFARDERFVIGVDPELAGFVWVAALGGHGMSTSFGVGRLGAAAVLGDRSEELSRLSPSRLGAPSA